MDLKGLMVALDDAPNERAYGRLVQAVGPLLEAELPGARLGSLWEVDPGALCEVVGFRERRALLMPLQPVEGARFGARVSHRGDSLQAPVGDALLGRVLDGFGNPIDGKGPLPPGPRRRVTSDAPAAMARQRITTPLSTGVKVIDGLNTFGMGQRIALTAGSGVGKSTLLGAIARQARADVAVVCLVGERGREVREFVEDNLGPEGLRRAVVVVATSDQSPALQVRSTFLATAIAESFRDADKDVVLMVDSLTRLALAQRQIGLAAGEPPTTRGYTPSVFSLLPRLLERAGPGEKRTITGIYTVLIEGDDVNDPIGDAVRGIVDGHLVLSRRLASHGHYPAVEVLGSLSRLMDKIVSKEHLQAASRFRDILATWSENEELIRLGAYRRGSSAPVDEAIERQPEMLEFLKQGNDPVAFEEVVRRLRHVARPAAAPNARGQAS